MKLNFATGKFPHPLKSFIVYFPIKFFFFFSSHIIMLYFTLFFSMVFSFITRRFLLGNGKCLKSVYKNMQNRERGKPNNFPTNLFILYPKVHIQNSSLLPSPTNSKTIASSLFSLSKKCRRNNFLSSTITAASKFSASYQRDTMVGRENGRWWKEDFPFSTAPKIRADGRHNKKIKQRQCFLYVPMYITRVFCIFYERFIEKMVESSFLTFADFILFV